nr:hypothetical protein [uncultured Victivallis sp.]
MLDQIILSGADRLDVGDQLADHIELVIAGKDDFFDAGFFHGTVGLPGRLLFPQGVDEFLQNIQKAVFLQDVAPDIAGHVVPLNGGISGAAVVSGTVGSLIEGQKESLFTFEPGGHGALIQIHRHEDEEPMVEFKCGFPVVPIILPLMDAVFDALPGQLILEFQAENRDAVDGEHHVDAVVVAFGIVPLADALTAILMIFLHEFGVEGGFRAEEADFQVIAAVFETVPQDMEDSVHLNRFFKAFVEVLAGLFVALFFQPRPCSRLGALDEGDQGLQVESLAGGFGAVVSGIGGFLPAALGGDQERFDILFKIFFGIVVHITLLHRQI